MKPTTDPFIETVIGSERIAMILQGVKSIFDTESYRLIVNFIHEFTNTCKDLPADLIIASERVIADHIRALYVLVANGAPPPGKNGRERIMRLLIRGILTRQIILGIKSKEFSTMLVKLVRTLDNNSFNELKTEKK